MNLIIATGIYPPDIGGPATYSKKIAEEFSKRGWNVIVLTYADIHTKQRETEHETTRNFKIVKISRAHNVIMRYFFYTLKLIKLAKSADLIYAQGPVSEGLPALIASKLTGKKYVLKVVGDPAWERWNSQQHGNTETQKHGNTETQKHENTEIQKQLDVETRPACAGRFIASNTKFIGLDEFQAIGRLPLKTIILKWVERFVAKNAYKIITPSQYLKKIVMMWGVDADKIKVVYNAAEEGGRQISNFPPNQRAGKFQISKVKEGDIILSMGRLVQWKGFDTLIDLMPKLLVVNPNFKLVIVGEGTEYESLLSRKQENKKTLKQGYQELEIKEENEKLRNKEIKKLFDEKVVLTGKLEHEKLLELMRKAKMFILNSGYEGLSHSVIEAMQSGLPCAVSDAGGNPELVENEKTGLLFEYNNRDEIKNAIVRLWQDEKLRERVVAGAGEKVKEFSFERMMGETEEILNFK